MEQIKSSDPEIHLENIKVEEQVVIKRLKEQEAQLRILLSELKALRNVKEEAIKHIQEKSDYSKEEEILQEEEIESIDKLVEDVQTTRQEGSDNKSYNTNETTQPIYNLPNAEQITTASDSRTINELYKLAEKEEHSTEDKQRFFEITQAIIKSKPYELNKILQEQVNNSYQALKTTIAKRPELANEYNPISSVSKVKEFLEAIKKDYKL